MTKSSNNLYPHTKLMSSLYILYALSFFLVRYDLKIAAFNFSISILLLTIVVLLYVLNFAFLKKRFLIHHHVFDWKIAIFLLILGIAFLFSAFANPDLLLGLEGVIRLLSWIITFYFAIYFLASDKLCKKVLCVMALSTIILSIIVIKKMWFDREQFLNIVFIAGNRNTCAHYLAIISPLVIGYFGLFRKKWFTTILYISVVSLAILLTGSRGGLISWLLALLVIVLFFRTKHRFFSYGIAFTVFMLIFYVHLHNSEIRDRNRSIYDQGFPSSNLFRLELVLSGIEMGLHNPLTGVGFNQFPQKMREYSLSRYVYFREEGFFTHNDYVKIFAEIGFVALCSFLGLLVLIYSRIMRHLSKINKIYPLKIGYDTYNENIATLASMIALLSLSMATVVFGNVFGWFLLGFYYAKTRGKTS